MIVYFYSSNPAKHRDVEAFFAGSKNPPRPLVVASVAEPLSHDLEHVVREKALTAYRKVKAPLFVEHGGLYIEHLRDLPGPMVKIFWEKLGRELCTLIPAGASRRAYVRQRVCYCDGRTLRCFEGTIKGEIATEPRGTGGMHWEPQFIPEGQPLTLGEMHPDERLARAAFAPAFKGLRDEVLG